MAAKVFEVNDVLPATTQLRISWIDDIYELIDKGEVAIRFDDNLGISRKFIYVDMDEDKELHIFLTSSDILICHMELGYFEFPYTNYDGNHPYCDIDTSTWDINRRTITAVEAGMDIFTWEDLNAPSGYTITFNSNGGSSISSINDATELPTLPIPTKSGYTFVAWYYESNFQTRAKAGDTIESNVTLYAKWHNLGSLFTEIADAIRSKDGTSGTIRDVDFGERVNAIQPAKEEETKTVTPNFSSGSEVVTPTTGKVLSQVTINKDSNLVASNIKKDVTVHGITGTSYIAIELTQAQYDALGTKDANTYYLIVEVE